MDKLFNIQGTLVISPKNITNKHIKQSSWKETSIIHFPKDDMLNYYRWFIEKRYNLVLNRPLRNNHLTVINDAQSNFTRTGLHLYKKDIGLKKKINIEYNPTLIRTDGKHWWIRIIRSHNPELMEIRQKYGLKKPYYGFHITLGYANERNIEHSQYIHRLIQKGLIK